MPYKCKFVEVQTHNEFKTEILNASIEFKISCFDALETIIFSWRQWKQMK